MQILVTGSRVLNNSFAQGVQQAIDNIVNEWKAQTIERFKVHFNNYTTGIKNGSLYLKLNDYNITLLHGGALGADDIAAKYAEKIGLATREFVPDWKAYNNTSGKNPAGVIRNMQMVDQLDPQTDVVLGFCLNKSAGTTQCLNYAKTKGIQRVIVHEFNVTPEKLLELERDYKIRYAAKHKQ